jgi:ribosomal protein S18 acetylase RimI-like enzyme
MYYNVNFNKNLKRFSEEGFLPSFLKILKFIKTNICGISKVIIFEFDLNNSVPTVSSQINFSIRMATKEDIDLIDEERYDYNLKGKQYSKERLSKGDKCFLALHNGGIIGYVWIMKNDMELSEFNHVPLSKKRVYTYKAFILKEFRGKRIRNAIDVYLFKMFRKAGKRFVICLVDKDNEPSIRCKERLGFKKIGYINQLRFFGLKYDYLKKNDRLYLQNQ